MTKSYFDQQRLDKSNSLDTQNPAQRSLRHTFLRFSIYLGVSAIILTGAAPSFADSVANSESTNSHETIAATPSEIDSSLTRTYIPTIIYLPDPETYRLVPQTVPVDRNAQVAGAVGQIINSYEGQDVGIEGYDVAVDQPNQIVRVDFDIDSEQNGREFYSLSSANQIALFESIRETLLTNPDYQIDEIIFSANGESFDI